MLQDYYQVIQCLSAQLAIQGFSARLHFELEGVYQPYPNQLLNYQAVNQVLANYRIPGRLKPEYWAHQWEYVSLFNQQTPWQEAQALTFALQQLPHIMCQHGAQSVLLKPVIWGGDERRLAPGMKEIFTIETRSVHIPNAIQINLSVDDQTQKNLIAESSLGEWLQHHLLINSYDCCLLFLPEEEAFKRLRLKEDYGLNAELSSPCVLSGGHQGSIALYREKGKHEQLLGIDPLVVDSQGEVLAYTHNWQKTARVEHRLGATSQQYNPYINIIFSLLNILEAIDSWKREPTIPQSLKEQPLPYSLHPNTHDCGAIQLFKQQTWLAQHINYYCSTLNQQGQLSIGERIVNIILRQYPDEIHQQ